MKTDDKESEAVVATICFAGILIIVIISIILELAR